MNEILVIVAGMILNSKRDQILLLRRNNPPYVGKWVMPGGKLETGEKLLHGLLREVQEETGLSVQNCRPIRTINEVLETEGSAEIHQFMIFYFACEYDGDEITNQNGVFGENREGTLKWFNSEEISTLDMVPSDQKIALQFFENKKVRISEIRLREENDNLRVLYWEDKIDW